MKRHDKCEYDLKEEIDDRINNEFIELKNDKKYILKTIPIL